MNSSLYTGVLGLQNHQLRMDVIGNNIANVNTYGFKKGRATFSDLLSRTYTAAASPRDGRGGINPLQVGMGMTTTAVTNMMQQGQIEATGRVTDVAIDGNGWFVLKDQSGSTVYTRDGSFGLDREGSLVNSSGWYVQGWTRVTVDDDHNFEVDTQRPVSSIDFQYGEKLEAAATTKVGLKCNLDEHSRSLIADGIDPKEGYATKNDLLVDLYDANSVNPNHLGLREGDWIEIHIDTQYEDINSTSGTAYSATAGTGVDVNGDGSLWRYTGTFDSTTLPIIDDGSANDFVTMNAGVLAGLTRSYESTGNLNAGEYSFDPNTGQIYVATAVGTANGPLDAAAFNYHTQSSALNTDVYENDKYLYIQVSNDTSVGDLETAIQNALDAIDVNGTINATVSFDSEDAQFYIYNNEVSGSKDYSSLHVEINAVSGSGIRRGYLLRESTYPTLTGTRLGITQGGLGGTMTREHIANFDYQTSLLSLDYGNVNGSPQIYGEVIASSLALTYAAANHNDGVQIGEWTGYTNGGTLQMVDDTDELWVNGTKWSNVNVFTGAANEYRISTTGNIPTVIFNTADSLEPTDGSTIAFSYRTQNFTPQLLSGGAGLDYTVDSTTGQISLNWSNSTANATLGNAGFTGTIRLTADYTTEERLLAPPGVDADDDSVSSQGAIMNSRWADFAQELAEVTAGGAGNGRTSFNNMFSALNAARDASSPGTIDDQGTSTQPTSMTTTRFQSAETYRTSIDVFDSLGDVHTLQFIFTHVGSNYDLTEQTRYQNRWYWRAELPYEDVMAFDSMDFVDDDTATARLDGELTFDSNGLLIFSELGGNAGPIIFDPSPIGSNGNTTEAVDQLSINIDFTGHGNAIDGVTQYASDFTTKAYEQNGWAMGILESFAVDESGIIEGVYSNDVVKPIAQLALAMFANEEGLTKAGDNVFKLSANTGLPSIVPAYVGGAGQISGGSLEQSNVDIVEEFTNMIITERGFQANSRMVTTSDEMLMEVINLKR